MLFVLPVFVYGENVVLLEEDLFESVGGGDAVQQDFGTYVNRMLQLTIGIAAVLAVIQITIGGLERMTKDSIQNQEDGRKRIQAAVIGLVLALTSVLILTTINTDLLNFDLGGMIDRAIENSGVEQNENGNGSSNSGNNTNQQELAQRLFLEEGHDIAVPFPPCPPPNPSGSCTNIADLPGVAISDTIFLKQACNCEIQINGAAEKHGHAEYTQHGPGSPVVDLQRTTSLENFIRENGQVVYTLPDGREVYELFGDEFFFEDPGHFHVCYNMQCAIKGRG